MDFETLFSDFQELLNGSGLRPVLILSTRSCWPSYVVPKDTCRLHTHECVKAGMSYLLLPFRQAKRWCLGKYKAKQHEDCEDGKETRRCVPPQLTLRAHSVASELPLARL